MSRSRPLASTNPGPEDTPGHQPCGMEAGREPPTDAPAHYPAVPAHPHPSPARRLVVEKLPRALRLARRSDRSIPLPDLGGMARKFMSRSGRRKAQARQDPVTPPA